MQRVSNTLPGMPPELKLREGDRFPIERLPSALERRAVVFFYPAAFTGGCTREVRVFNGLIDEFGGVGVDVLGASVDAQERNADFCDQEDLQFELVSDPGRELAEELGILTEAVIDGETVAARFTYLLEADGTILKIWEVGPGEAIDAHPDEVLAAARALA